MRGVVAAFDDIAFFGGGVVGPVDLDLVPGQGKGVDGNRHLVIGQRRAGGIGNGYGPLDPPVAACQGERTVLFRQQGIGRFHAGVAPDFYRAQIEVLFVLIDPDL